MAKVPCEVLSFTTTGNHECAFGIRREALRHTVLKSFNESSAATREKWVCVTTGMGNNCDGESVLWAAKRLIQRKETRKVLITFSDGQPAIAALKGGCGDDEEHLKDVVKLIESAGIETLGVGIQDSSVKNYYPKWVVYRTLDDLMVGFYRVVSDLLRTGKLAA